MNNDLSVNLGDVIIEAMPFSNELREYCRKNPEFLKALKVIYPERFITLGAVATSYSHDFSEDEVIGVYAYDYGGKTPKFKQDFIVNIDGKAEEFILYTGLGSVVDGRRVKHIKEFFVKYGKGGHYERTHWLSFDELPEELKERARRAIALAEKRMKAGNPPIAQDHIEKIHKQLIGHKRSESSQDI